MRALRAEVWRLRGFAARAELLERDREEGATLTRQLERHLQVKTREVTNLSFALQAAYVQAKARSYADSPSRRGDGGGGGGGGGTHVAVISETQRRLHKRARAANAANAAASADVAAGGYELCQVPRNHSTRRRRRSTMLARVVPTMRIPSPCWRGVTSVTPLPGGAASSSSVCVVRYIGWQRWANLSPRCSRTMLWLAARGLSRPCARRGRAHAAAAAAAGRRWCRPAGAAGRTRPHSPQLRTTTTGTIPVTVAAPMPPATAPPPPQAVRPAPHLRPHSASASRGRTGVGGSSDAPYVYHPPGALAKPSRPSSAQAKLRSGPMGHRAAPQPVTDPGVVGVSRNVLAGALQQGHMKRWESYIEPRLATDQQYVQHNMGMDMYTVATVRTCHAAQGP